MPCPDKSSLNTVVSELVAKKSSEREDCVPEGLRLVWGGFPSISSLLMNDTELPYGRRTPIRKLAS
jgi:hypothetical protein